MNSTGAINSGTNQDLLKMRFLEKEGTQLKNFALSPQSFKKALKSKQSFNSSAIKFTINESEANKFASMKHSIAEEKIEIKDQYDSKHQALEPDLIISSIQPKLPNIKEK